MIHLTDEQEMFIQTVMTGKNVHVEACIGSGKTTAIQQLCNRIEDKKILYLTYNKLLKVDARSKIKQSNVTVTNYHGFAYMILKEHGITCGTSELIQNFILYSDEFTVPHYDLLVIDEYQDIETELAEMLEIIKEQNPDIQIVVVGDICQKIYDKTSLDVVDFINEFLEEHEIMEFTKCFRLSKAHASLLGDYWGKKITGVNPNCDVEIMDSAEIFEYCREANPSDLLCLGARTGKMSILLNELEERCPRKYNKKTVYASIRDNDSDANLNPSKDTAIFTTFDSSKGLEKKICIVFDWNSSYWQSRFQKADTNPEILKNIFLVAASRGKEKIIFVLNKNEKMCNEEDFNRTKTGVVRKDVDISDMLDFKYKEDIEYCFRLLNIRKVPMADKSFIQARKSDGYIDISPCIGHYQEHAFFENNDIDTVIKNYSATHDDFYLSYGDKERSMSLEKKILFLASLETQQVRYFKQVNVPYITKDTDEAIRNRLRTKFTGQEDVQVPCILPFGNSSGKLDFAALGIADVVTNDTVYELKFKSEVEHVDFIQCAVYMIALGLKKGCLWNTQTNEMYKIKIPNESLFLDALVLALTKGQIKKYIRPNSDVEYTERLKKNFVDKINKKYKKKAV